MWTHEDNFRYQFTPATLSEKASLGIGTYQVVWPTSFWACTCFYALFCHRLRLQTYATASGTASTVPIETSYKSNTAKPYTLKSDRKDNC